MSSAKFKTDRKLLGQHGIIISENMYSPRSHILNTEYMPDHVQHLREALLDHEIQLPDSLKSLFEQEKQVLDATNVDYSILPSQSEFFSLPHNLLRPMASEIKNTEDKFKEVAKLAHVAREYVTTQVSQQTWEHFLRSYIFQSFEDSAVQTSKHGKLFDAFSLEKTMPWEAVSQLNQISENAVQPTFTYGFPVHVNNAETLRTGLSRNDCVANFAINTLGDLATILPCPTVHPLALKTRMIKGQRLEKSDLICFPWALVEVQPTTEPAESCYFRAAQGAHTALNILKQLYRPTWAATKAVMPDIPPIITFTCCGPEIRVWLAFTEFNLVRPVTRIVCIWAGTLTATWCIINLREIIKNMTFWASRVLKPDVSLRISQIRSAAHPVGTTILPKTASRGTQTLEDPDTSELQRLNSIIESGDFLSSHQTNIFGSSNPKFRIKYLMHRGKRITIRFPSSDQRKPLGWLMPKDRFSPPRLRRTAQAVTSGQTALVDNQTISGSDRTVVKSPGDQQTSQIGRSDKAEEIIKALGKLGFEDNLPDSGSSELGAPKKSPTVNAETQEVENKSSTPANAGVDDVEDDGFLPEYFVYRTAESFQGRGYDATIWDSEDDDDKSYVAPSSGSEQESELDSEPHSEASKEMYLEGNNADDEESDSSESDDAYEEKRPSKKPKIETDTVESWGSPGQVRKLTITDIDDLMYCATNVISGGDFITLKAVYDLLENLNGVDLLDATWRSLEAWEGQSPSLFSAQMAGLRETVDYLNNFSASRSEIVTDPFKVHHLTMALRKEDLDRTLRIMQKDGDYNLRAILKYLLAGWEGEKCMEILSNELLGLSPEKFEDMLQEALDVVSSDMNLLGTV